MCISESRRTLYLREHYKDYNNTKMFVCIVACLPAVEVLPFYTERNSM